ncbi:hypothetical protein [Sphingomonas sp. TDK1]|uniref:hypothetical protein n=1 Tax=Sphingomonas sp. TDK1 TaxID=453247 RepID=UPI0007D8F6BA|nr:hypothetical protein [Sphingomonas sp. TDK1]OAN57255.1 hypothetical protein A7X12_08565 [Sphingomonas sp. TDK1]
MMSRRQGLALALAAIVAVAMPAMLLRPGTPPPAVPARAVRSLEIGGRPPLAHAYDRALFAATAAEEAPLPADAPQLTGIVGRLGTDAVALVRTAQGSSRSLALGDSVDGWKLESLSIDAALFSRGGQRARVPMPAADAGPPAQ